MWLLLHKGPCCTPFLLSKGHLLVQGGNSKVLTESKQPDVLPKIQQTKMLVTCQRFGDLFWVWQYTTNQNQ